jgi:hypothetical protein
LHVACFAWQQALNLVSPARNIAVLRAGQKLHHLPDRVFVGIGQRRDPLEKRPPPVRIKTVLRPNSGTIMR